MEETTVNQSEPIPEPEATPSLLMEYGMWYAGIHGYTSVIVCLFGIGTNFINITILNRRDMRTPTNILLTWLAVADILTMIPYVPLVIHFYIEYPSEVVSAEKNTYGWMLYYLFLINFSVTTHTISIWLCVGLAVFRHIQMSSTTKGPVERIRRMKQAVVITVVVFVLPTLALIPNYLANKLVAHPMPDNSTLYMPPDLKLATNETETLVFINVMAYAIAGKIVPCFLILIFSGSLIYTLVVKARNRKRRLSNISRNSSRVSNRSKTTRLLLVVVILFVITEFPQGVFIVLSATVTGFYHNVYMPLGDMMDFVALLNNAINFVLYCVMSQQFRNKFISMYLKGMIRLKTAASTKSSTFTSVTEVC